MPEPDNVTHIMKRTANEALLLAAFSLTHRIHAASRKKDREKELELRDQRDKVATEILRRMDP